MTAKRFRKSSCGTYIIDDLTGEYYHPYNPRLLGLLNNLNSRVDRNAELYWKYKIVLDKYGIHDAEKLDACLREGRVW